MATIIILFGSILGFLGGLTVYFGFEATFWTALNVWMAAGPASVLFVLLMTWVAPQNPDFDEVRVRVA